MDEYAVPIGRWTSPSEIEARIAALEAALAKQRAVNEAWSALLEYIGNYGPPEDAIPAARALHAAVREALSQ